MSRTWSGITCCSRIAPSGSNCYIRVSQEVDDVLTYRERSWIYFNNFYLKSFVGGRGVGQGCGHTVLLHRSEERYVVSISYSNTTVI